MAGGILLSISVLFGGLAFTVMTVKADDNENSNNEEMEEFEDLYE